MKTTALASVVLIIALALMAHINLPKPLNEIIHGTDSAVLSDNLIITPTAWHVGDMPDGFDGYVGMGAIFVDANRKLWIAPDWTVAKDWWSGDLHIKREGEDIILFKNSIGDNRWTPGVDSGWHVDKQTNLIAIKLRG